MDLKNGNIVIKMKKVAGIPDSGVYCCDCEKYYWYKEIKNMKCPKGHNIGD